MHWFEQLTGLSPDGGNGMLEALYDVVAAAAVCTAALAARRKLRRRRSEAAGRDR